MTPTAPSSSPEVHPPGWLELQQLLGVGGMGKVYQALDTRSGDVIAVKTLTNFVGKELLCLKNEFRSFAGVVHPNLISQHELVENDGQWFLLMELLEGVELLYHLRGQTPPSRLHTPVSGSSKSGGHSNPIEAPTEEGTRTVETSTTEPDAAPVPTGKKDLSVRRVLSPAEIERAIPVLRQLALGIEAIHRSGFLHRDVKPSNVLVSPGGRTVLLDFGIAIAKQAAKAEAGINDVVVGTPAYLAPELLRGQPASSASDWFSFGVLMFEALSGGRPWASGVSYRARTEVAPPRVTQFGTGIAEPLADLVARLLLPDPTQRPTFTEIITVLGGQADATDASSGTQSGALIGRHEERQRLRALAAQARQKPTSIFIRGRSGVGKTVLIAEVLRELERSGWLVLHGRCYEQEIVPYKTVDKLVDSLTTELEHHRDWVDELKPSDVAALTRAFPVLRAVFTVTDAQQRNSGDDPADLQRRAIVALTEVLQRLAKKVPLAVCVDDLQWGDVVGAQVLMRLSVPGGPPALVIGGFRTEDSASPTIRVLGELFRRETGHSADVMSLEPLSESESAELAQVMAAEAGIKDPALVKWALTESEGQPFFLHELLYAAAHNPEIAKPNLGQGLQDVVANRIASLPQEIRQLIEVVCLAGSVVPLEVATHASGVQHSARLYQQLRAGHFIRTTRRDDKEFVDTYHDKFREVVSARLDPERAQMVHAGLVHAWLKESAQGAGRGFALANHARLAGPHISSDVSFAVQRDAAFEAVATFDSARAREFLLGAQAVAATKGESLSPELERVLGDVSLAADDLEGAKVAFERVLAKSDDSAVRAGAHTGLSRLFMSSLNTREAFAESGKALQTLGLKPVRSSLLDLVGALLSVLWTWARHQVFGAGRQRSRDEFAAQLYSMSGFSGYFLFDRKLLLGGSLRGYAPMTRLPPSGATAEWYGFSSVIASVAGLRGLSRSMIKTGHQVAVQVNDPAAQAFVAGFEALAVDMGGEPLEGERLGLAAVENGTRMAVSGYLTVVAGVTWNVLMRGQVRKAQTAVNHGLARMESTGQSLIARGHTFRSYLGTIYALLGQPDQAKAGLDAYTEFLHQHAPDDVFRLILLLGHRAFFLHLTGASDAELDACFKQHDDYGIASSLHVQTLRHIFLAKAMRRGDQLVAKPGDAALISDATALVQTLRSFGQYQTIVLHRELLEAKLQWAKGEDPLTALRTLRERAERLEAPWLVIEAMIAEAMWLRSKGKPDQAERLQVALEALATEHGLLGLITRSRRFVQLM